MKLDRARQSLKEIEKAAASAALVHSMSDEPPVVLPDVDTHLHLPPVSTLLTDEENAVIQGAKFKDGAWVGAVLSATAPF